MGSFADLLTDPRVYAYFAALLWSAQQCFRRSAAWGRALAALCVCVTWYFIVPYIVDYAGDELFDDAYADVVRGGAWFWSSQLLTWVVVGMVWMKEASICYPVLGMLGAMSAAFLTWLAADVGTSSSPSSSAAASKRHLVSAWYAPMSAVSLLCIYQLPRALATDWFSFWLRGLHVALIVPAMVARPYGFKISGAWLHAALGVAIAAFHLAFFRREIGLLLAADASALSWPVTNCQISITIDLLVCALLTVAAVHWHYASVLISGAAAVATIVISPGAVLALHLALRGDGSGSSSSVSLRARLVTWLQHAAAKRERAIHRNSSATSSGNGGDCDGGHVLDWMNLGLGGWRGDGGSATGASAGSYDDACARLSLTLGAAVMRRGDGVLAVGCGFGAELVQWKRAFDLLHITGVDPNEAAAAQFRPHQHNVRLLCATAADVCAKFGAHGSGGARFDRIVALDSIYHFADKAAFLADAAAIAPRTGTLGVTDLIVLPSSGTIPIWLRALLWCMNVNSSELWSEGEYRQHLERAGWANATIQMLGSSGIDCDTSSAATASGVLDAWMPACVRRHLGYALIVATKCASIAPGAAADPRPTVAIVGSGISGLTCAQLLKHSHNVTVFEANDKCGLSGHGMDVAGQCVDAPLRIIGQGYYRFMEKLVRSVDVTLQPIREDFFSQCHYGKSDSDEPKVTLTASVWSNLVALLPHARDLSRMRRNLYDGSHTGSATSTSLDCLDDDCDETQTFGEWCAERRYRLWPHAGESSGIGSSASADGEHDDIVLWLLMGQASWMLSCSYEQVLGYPARTILDFYRGLRLGTSTCDFLCSSPQSGRMLRVMPSMAALEHELIYGCRTEFGARVGDIGASRVVGGRKFDRVVIATEAAAVPKVLSPSVQCTDGGSGSGGGKGELGGGESVASVFARVQYQPSTLFVHADPTLMPPRRADWCAVNVHQPSADRASMCQLTIWLNAFYPEHAFPHDVFETWNPFHRPSRIIKELHFLRVVHTRETPALLRRIDAMQGTAGGVYFAGAYAVDGMGLLEQGALSAKKVADLIHAELAATALTAEPGNGSSAPLHHAAEPAAEPAASKRKSSAAKPSAKSAARTPRASRTSLK
jgi:hypothetical protein